MTNTWKIGLPTATYAECSSFSSLGISNLRRTLVATGPDEVSFSVSAQLALTADTDFAYKTRYTIWKDASTRWFTGIVTSIPRQGDSKSESMDVTLSGPWWYFENCLFQQVWHVWDQDAEEVVEEARCRVILFNSTANVRMTSGSQIEEVIAWLIARGAPIAQGTVDAGIALPYDEQVNMSCAAVVHTVLRWMPDQVGWFDYSVEPPTFNFRARSSLSTVTQAIANVTGIGITPRYDLQKPGVQIVYEQTNTVDNVSYCTRTIDTAGDATAIDAIHAVFDLAGSSVSYLKQKIETLDMPAADWTQAQLKAWIMGRVHWLNKNNVSDIVVESLTPDPNPALPRELTRGQIQDWMKEAPNSLQEEDNTVNVQFTRVVRDANNNPVDVETGCIGHVKVKTTDAVTKTYQVVASWDSGEPVPTGVAAQIYLSWGTLHYDGGFLLTESECSGSIFPGRIINISGGRTEWASMNAVVQSVQEDIDVGTTQIRFGPPAALEADSLVALLRALRGRRYAYRREDRSTGESNGQTDVEISGQGPIDQPAVGPGQAERKVIQKDVEE